METQIAIYSYIDENLHVIYAPSLALFGYGDDETEARQSFEITLTEYFDYQAENNTLEKDLLANNWQIKENEFYQPSFQIMVQNDEEFSKILQKPYKKTNWVINLPIFA